MTEVAFWLLCRYGYWHMDITQGITCARPTNPRLRLQRESSGKNSGVLASLRFREGAERRLLFERVAGARYNEHQT
jgi:hypothetical protein